MDAGLLNSTMTSEACSSTLTAAQTVRNSLGSPIVASPASTGLSTNGTSSGLLVYFTAFTFRVLAKILYWLITFASITLPTWLFTLFSTPLTVTINFTTLLLILALFASTVSWFVRYRFLNMYSRLPPEPQRKEEHIDLFPDTDEADSKRGIANYLDEFLSAIKVFGYLDRDIFAELTRSMQTRKLIAGETLFLEEEKGFCLVVDGLVQIFVKSRRDADHFYGESLFNGEDSPTAESGNQGYQLLTEVKNGAPMSSLFSILSLFTEDIKLRHVDSDEAAADLRGPLSGNEQNFAGVGTRGEPLQMTPTSPTSPTRKADHFRSKSDKPAVASRDPSFHTILNPVPPLSLDMSSSLGDSYFDTLSPTGSMPPKKQPAQPGSFHPDILARAKIDTTIAVIPATAFRRLTRNHPKAIAHIVQVILTRLQRVTLATGHAYLGLTSEVLRSEKQMGKYTTYDLPNALRGNVLERLKARFRKERERIGPEEGMKGIALHNAGATRKSKLSRGQLPKASASSRSPKSAVLSNGNASAHPLPAVPTDYTARVSPGDLLTSVQRRRQSSREIRPSLQLGSLPPQLYDSPDSGPIDLRSPLAKGSFNPFASPNNDRKPLHRQESVDEDGLLRISILECIFKAIGLTDTNNAFHNSTSVEQSPRMVSYDSKRQKAVFYHAFGLIQPIGSIDGDTDSVISAPLSTASVGGNYSRRSLIEDLRDDVEIVFFPEGSVLVEQGERNPGLYFLIDGFLDVSTPSDDKVPNGAVFGPAIGQTYVDESSGNTSEHESGQKAARDKGTRQRRESARQNLFLIKPGGLAGYIGTISSYRSFIDVRAKTDVYVGFLPRSALERIVEKYPVVLLTMAKRLTSLLPRLILHLDFALEWVQIDAGQVIYHQGDESDAIFIVLNGRLRALHKNKKDELRVLGEYGQGESVGELEVLTESTRPATVHAIRDTELAKLPKTLFNSLALEHPGITIRISKIIASRMRALVEDPLSDNSKDRGAIATAKRMTSTLNIRTVAILPVTAGVPVIEFGSRLMSALMQVGATKGVTSLNQAAILNHLGRHAFSRMGKLKLSQYLADLEEAYGLVLYVADTNVNAPWTQTCISQADCILLVGLADGPSSIGEYEKFLLGMKTTARKELVLLHAEKYVRPGLTRSWLKNRMWINGGHHHIQMAAHTKTGPQNSQAKRIGTALIQRVQVIQAEIQKYTSRKIRQTPIYSSETPLKNDFHRLARRLCGKSLGLVLGGGGARGLAHIGVIRAIEESGLPIDVIGGTSIGALVGALYARDADVVPMYGRAKKFAGRMASMWRFALDLTYPSASYTTGHEFNRGIFKAFGDSQIEDFWLEFYCNTTNISKSRSEIHNSGYCWRYVRASMSLAGLLPPLCDEGSMLLDGGYIDNLTVAHMKSLGVDVVFAIDVGSLDDTTPQKFGDSLSGFWATMNRWNPFSSFPNPPTLSEIQGRLAYVSSVDALERAKNMPGCLYMRPPIDNYGTLDFAKFDEICKVGYEYGKDFLAKARSKHLLPGLDETEEKKQLRRTLAPRRASI
ncbi:MAG: phosphatidylcholine and lysophosphatidylcholine phospholipase [Vezdaea aestivalis]|nr:MAG: phosphatidylcholine and lysophosphatidylcholine phospholipase [Vezdaea aestivalis]